MNRRGSGPTFNILWETISTMLRTAWFACRMFLLVGFLIGAERGTTRLCDVSSTHDILLARSQVNMLLFCLNPLGIPSTHTIAHAVLPFWSTCLRCFGILPKPNVIHHLRTADAYIFIGSTNRSLLVPFKSIQTIHIINNKYIYLSCLKKILVDSNTISKHIYVAIPQDTCRNM